VYASPRHPVLKKLSEHRTVTAHEGPLWIQPEHVADPHEFRFYWDKTPVLGFANEVLKVLYKIQEELKG
ncbi:MAG: hypothetical protein ACRD88_08435, partial [Terriglobia bacterium]